MIDIEKTLMKIINEEVKKEFDVMALFILFPEGKFLGKKYEVVNIKEKVRLVTAMNGEPDKHKTERIITKVKWKGKLHRFYDMVLIAEKNGKKFGECFLRSK